MKQLIWLRNDLRLDDNPLFDLAQAQGPITVIHCATPKQWQLHHESPAKLGLKASLLNDIGQQLAAKGIELILQTQETFNDIPQSLLTLCHKEQIKHLWFTEETPWNEVQRDKQVTKLLRKHGIEVSNCPPDLIVNQPVLNKQGHAFKVFTPYYKTWLQQLLNNQQLPFAGPKKQAAALPWKAQSFSWAGGFREDLWPGTEKAARQKLRTFSQQRLLDYASQRDYPATPGTSTLSPYLAQGVLGPRRLLEAVQVSCAQSGKEWLADDWLRELAWRDFYRQLMTHFPHISRNMAFKRETDRLIWSQHGAGFKAWSEGKTGFPIIDAAMRQLLQTGWMHNRLRMLAASFLTKLLFMDWRRGETFFMQQLIDGEFASNNGGWQWSASTGCDAAPYFRVFNPTRQSEKFDPDGEFIRRFVPELAELSNKSIHNPSGEERVQTGYPEPVVDYKAARQFAIAQFAALK